MAANRIELIELIETSLKSLKMKIISENDYDHEGNEKLNSKIKEQEECISALRSELKDTNEDLSRFKKGMDFMINDPSFAKKATPEFLKDSEMLRRLLKENNELKNQIKPAESLPNENSDDIRLKSENSRLKYENAQMFEEIAKLRGEVETAKLCFDKIAKLKCLNEELNEEMKNLKTLNINLRDQLEEMYNLNKELNEENEKMKLSNECTTNTSKSGELQNVKDLLNIERNKNKTLSDEVESFKELLDGRLSSEEFTKKLPKVLLEGSDTFCVMKRDNDELKNKLIKLEKEYLESMSRMEEQVQNAINGFES